LNENLRGYSIFKERIASSNTAPPRLGAERRRSRSKGRYRVAVQNRRNRRTARRGRDASPYWRSDVVIGSGTSHAAAPTAIRDRAFQRGLLHYALSGVAPPAATSSALNGYPGPNYAPHKCAGEWTSLRRLLATRKASAGASRTALHGSGTSAWLDADRKCPESEIICTLLGSFGKEKVAVFPRSALACTPPQGASADRRVYRPRARSFRQGDARHSIRLRPTDWTKRFRGLIRGPPGLR
jgi:hypothetical protein